MMAERITCEECEKEIGDKQVVFCEPCVERGEEVWKELLSEVLNALGIKPGHSFGEDVERGKTEAKKAKRLDAVIAELKVHLGYLEDDWPQYRSRADQNLVRMYAGQIEMIERLLKIAKGRNDEF